MKIFKKKKKSEYSFELVRENKDLGIEEVKCYKDGVYTHSVNVLVFPESIVEELERIHKKLNGRESIS